MVKIILGFVLSILLVGCGGEGVEKSGIVTERPSSNFEYSFAGEGSKVVLNEMSSKLVEVEVGSSVVFSFMEIGVEGSLRVEKGEGLAVFFGEKGSDFVSYPGVSSNRAGRYVVRVDDGVNSGVVEVMFLDKSDKGVSEGMEIGEISEVSPDFVDEGDVADMPVPDISAMDDQARKVARFTNRLIGLDADRAKLMLDGADIRWRVGVLDGKAFALTMDYNPSRVTLSIVGGKVTEALVG